MAVLADLQRITVRRVERVLFEELSLLISDGDRVGIVGANGSGKSTLLRVIAGAEGPDEGQVLRGRGSRVGFLEQVPVLAPGTVGAAVGAGWESEAALERLGMGASAAVDVSTLSGGQAKRVALATVLAHPSELLVLDEPTNHLDLGAISWLEQRLHAFRGGLVLVTHDRYLLDRLTTKIIELDRGRAFVHDGGYEGYLERAVREELAASAESTRRNLARSELAWLRRGAKARTRKPQARIDAAKRLLAGGPLAAQGSAELTGSTGAGTDSGTDTVTPRLGDKVIDCVDVGFRYTDGGPLVLGGVHLSLDQRERLGIVGVNGSGKSTLFDLMAGRRVPTAGMVDTGPTVAVGYYDQQGADLDLQARVQDLVAGPDRSPGSLADIALMKRFLFTGELPFSRVGTLSGGERRRLQLLLVLARRPNVLFLDEPTNDLDLDTLRILEDFLEDWPGALVVVSHDRAFLERTTDHIVAVEGGAVAEVPGGVEGWIARMEATTNPARSDRPARPDRPAGSAPLGRILREAEKRMAKLQLQRDKLVEQLATVADSADHVQMHRLGDDLAALQSALSEAEEEWLTLAEESEASS